MPPQQRKRGKDREREINRKRRQGEGLVDGVGGRAALVQQSPWLEGEEGCGEVKHWAI